MDVPDVLGDAMFIEIHEAGGRVVANAMIAGPMIWEDAVKTWDPYGITHSQSALRCAVQLSHP